MKKFIIEESLPDVLSSLQEKFLTLSGYDVNIFMEKGSDYLPSITIRINKVIDQHTREEVLSRRYHIIPSIMDDYDVVRDLFNTID